MMVVFVEDGIVCFICLNGGMLSLFLVYFVLLVIEYCVGIYIYNDCLMVCVGYCMFDDCVMYILVIVVLRLMLDCVIFDVGFKVFILDFFGFFDYGLIVEYFDVVIIGFLEEYVIVDFLKVVGVCLQIGEKICIVFNYICVVFNFFNIMIFYCDGIVIRVEDVVVCGLVW